MIMYWLLYDIPSQKKRLQLVRLCKDNGLTRIQKSCFFGEIKKSAVESFQKEIEKLVDADDSVYMIPISQASLEETKTWGTPDVVLRMGEEDICFI